jgi:nitrite reductase/ring-hydroxylating ferredoxin subunit
MAVLAGIASALLGLIPIGLGLGFFFDPLVRRQRVDSGGTGGQPLGRSDSDGFVRLDIGTSALPDDGTPVAYKVLDDRTDAWNRFRNIEIGTVWLRRVGEGKVLAFSSICPHLGCAVDFRAAHGDFYCPCHTSAFDLQGAPVNDIPPRGMDSLETRLKPETGDTIWLKYQVFRATIAEKIPVS